MNTLDETEENKTKQDKTRQNKTKKYNTIQHNTNTKQNNTKQYNTKLTVVVVTGHFAQGSKSKVTDLKAKYVTNDTISQI